MRQNKYELRISIPFIFRHCFMLPFSPYPILLITLNTMLVTSSERMFFYVSPFARFFFQTSFSCRNFLGRLSPHLRVFLIVRPLVLTKCRSRSQSSSSQNLKLSIVWVRGFTGFARGRKTRRKTDSSEKIYINAVSKISKQGL